MRTAVLLVPLALLGAGGGGCSGGGDDGEPAASEQAAAETSTTSPALRPCSEERHVVSFDFAGLLTMSQDDWAAWIQGEAVPDMRPGGPEVVQAYLQRGYEVLYVTTAPPNVLIDGLPVPGAVEAWLDDNGFPPDDRASVLGYTGGGGEPNAPVLSITDELVRLAANGVHLDAAYTDNADKAHAFASGGVPAGQIYMLGQEAGVEGTIAIPDDDLTAHATTLQALPPICALA